MNMRDQKAKNMMAATVADEMSLSELRKASNKTMVAVLHKSHKDVNNFEGLQHSNSKCLQCIRKGRRLLGIICIWLTCIAYFVLSATTLFYPPISFGIALTQRLTDPDHVAWDGVRLFQSVLFCASFSLFLGLLYKGTTVLPWYVRCLWHMIPITSTNFSTLSRVLGSGPHKPQVLDAIFQRTVAVYSARSGRTEDDIYEEVEEHSDAATSAMTGYCMECLHILGRAA